MASCRAASKAGGGEFFKKGWWLWLLTPIALVTYIGIPFVYALFKAVQMRWWLNGLRLGGVRLESRLDHRCLPRPVLEGDRLG